MTYEIGRITEALVEYEADLQSQREDALSAGMTPEDFE